MSIRLSKALSELNIGLQTAVEFLEKRKDGDGEKFGPTSKLTDAQYSALVEAFKQDAAVRTEAEKLFQKKPKEKKHSSETKDSNNESLLASAGKQEYKPLGKIDLDSVGKPTAKQSGATKQDNTPQPKAAAVSQAKENKSSEKKQQLKNQAGLTTQLPSAMIYLLYGLYSDAVKAELSTYPTDLPDNFEI